MSLDELRRHTFLTVHGSDQRLAMSMSPLDKTATFHLSDYHAKKDALLAGLGYGWMPEYLVGGQLAARRLLVLLWDGEARHTFLPVLHWQG